MQNAEVVLGVLREKRRRSLESAHLELASIIRP